MKGGVGKTTLASQLAHAASADGLRVLAVDLDPQSNLSHAIMGGQDYRTHLREERPTVAEILDGYIPAGGAIDSPTRDNPYDTILRTGNRKDRTLDLIPSRLELSRVLKNPAGRRRHLARFLGRVSRRYDLIVIDCAPTESVLTEVAYSASRHLIVPVKPEFMATIGLPLLARSVDEFQAKNTDHALDIAGIVVIRQSGYQVSREARDAIKEVRSLASKHGWHVFRRHMPYSVSYAKAARHGTSISRTPHARTDVVERFQRLKDEILEAVEIRPRVR